MALEGHIDGLVVSTGHPPSGELLELDDEDWRSGLDLVLLSVITAGEAHHTPYA